jgi:hypothetical protein
MTEFVQPRTAHRLYPARAREQPRVADSEGAEEESRGPGLQNPSIDRGRI